MRKQSIVPNANTYGILIEKSENYTVALKWYKEAERRTPIDSSILSAMIEHSNKFEEVFVYVEKALDLLVRFPTGKIERKRHRADGVRYYLKRKFGEKSVELAGVRESFEFTR